MGENSKATIEKSQWKMESVKQWKPWRANPKGREIKSHNGKWKNAKRETMETVETQLEVEKHKQ